MDSLTPGCSKSVLLRTNRVHNENWLMQLKYQCITLPCACSGPFLLLPPDLPERNFSRVIVANAACFSNNSL